MEDDRKVSWEEKKQRSNSEGGIRVGKRGKVMEVE